MSSLAGLEIVIYFIALIPGYISVKSARKVGDITNPLDRFEITIWSFIGSAISISVLFFAYVLIVSIRNGSVRLPELVIDIETVVLAFPLLVAVALVVGIVTGNVVQRLKIVRLSRDISEPTWDYIVHKIHRMDEPIKVRVNTDGGEEIRGYIGKIGTTNDYRDLILVYPERIQRTDEEINTSVDDGEFFYIREDAINSISFDVDINALQLPGASDE